MIFWADLNPVKGHEQAGIRPVLILQNNILNENLSTILVAPITTNLKAKGFLTTYFLTKKESHLEHDSVILLYQIRTIDKQRLQSKSSAYSFLPWHERQTQDQYAAHWQLSRAG